MPIRIDSALFDGIRGPVAGGLTDRELGAIVDTVNLSPIFQRRMRGFEEARGALRFDTVDRNCFWVENELPFIYLSPKYGHSNGGADVAVIAQLLAHELAHFETYFLCNPRVNPNNQRTEHCAAALGVRDEARAYAMEVLVEREIRAAGGSVDWTQDDQKAGFDAGVRGLESAGEIEKLDAATIALLEWAGNWTDDESKGGYYQYYQNSWLGQHDPNRSVVTRKVTFSCNAQGDIVATEFDDLQERRRLGANIDPPVPRLGL